MKITYYLYNSFIIEWDDKKIVIDPGGLFFYYFRFTTLIPKKEWNKITHVFVTHGDPDHYWHTDRVLKASDATIIFNKTMVEEVNGKLNMLGPRSKGLSFDTPLNNKYCTLTVDETIDVDGMTISGLKTTHGSFSFKIGPFSKIVSPGPKERVGWGAIGFRIDYNGKSIINLGDSYLNAEEWEKYRNTDVLMIPIGGNMTMDEVDAIEAVKVFKPKLVIPCHYNCPAYFSRKLLPANDKMFKEEVEKLGLECNILEKSETVEL